MQYKEAMSYLPDESLCRVGYTGMGVGLETRTSCINHRIVEITRLLQLGLTTRYGRGRWALKQNSNRYVPKALVERSKQGLGISLGESSLWSTLMFQIWLEKLREIG